MASEYYKKKFQDVKADAPYEMTNWEAFCNWWTYHWVTVLVVSLIVTFFVLLAVEFITRDRPDYKIAYVGADSLVVDIEKLQSELELLGEDLNGDGEVCVQIRSYLVDSETSMFSGEAIPFVGDIETGNSTIFILEDPEWFYEKYHITTEEDTYRWSDCPALSHIDLYGDYAIALRTTDDMEEGYEIDLSLWQAMTKDAD